MLLHDLMVMCLFYSPIPHDVHSNDDVDDDDIDRNLDKSSQTELEGTDAPSHDTVYNIRRIINTAGLLRDSPVDHFE